MKCMRYIVCIVCVVHLSIAHLHAEEFTVSDELREKLLQYAMMTLCGFEGTEDIVASSHNLTDIEVVEIDENEYGITHVLRMKPQYIKDGVEYPRSQCKPYLLFSVNKEKDVFFSGMFFGRYVDIVVRDQKIVGILMYSANEDDWVEYEYAEGRFHDGNGNIVLSDGS